MTNNVINSPVHFAYRQMQTQCKDHRFVALMGAVIFVLTIAGPFGTLESFNLLERFAYWAIVAPTTFITANLTATICTVFCINKGFNEWLSYAIGGIVAGIPIGLIVWLINIGLDRSSFVATTDLIEITIKTTLVTLPVTLLLKVLSKPRDIDPTAVQPTDMSTQFFKRLPHKIGHDLISLQAQDHYILVVTRTGSEMILMRLSDAIEELGAHKGIQTHRSWWVAEKHIVNTGTENGKKYIHLTNGQKIPISRTYLKQVNSFFDAKKRQNT